MPTADLIPSHAPDIDRSTNHQPRPDVRLRWGELARWVVGATCVIGAVWISLSPATSVGAPVASSTVPRVRVVSAVTVTGARRHSFSGTVRAERDSMLSFVAGGRLLSREVKAGDRVRVGDVLARVDARAVVHARAALNAQIESLTTQRDQLTRDVTRVQQLSAQGAAPTQQREQLEAQLRALTANIDAANAQRDEHDRQSGEAMLRSPLNGVVTDVLSEVGEVLAPGQPVLRVAAVGGHEVEVHVPQSLVSAIALGETVDVAFPLAGLATRQGQVIAVSPSAKAGHALYPVRVHVDDAQTVHAGTTVEVTFSVRDGVRFLLPADAIRAPTSAAAWVLAVDEQQRVHTVAIEVEGASDDGIVVQGDLGLDARVVVGAPAGLQAGARVELAP